MSNATTDVGIGVRALTGAEVDATATMLAAAFDDDPLFRYLLPESGVRAHWLRIFHTVAIGGALAAGGAQVVAEGPGSGAIGLFRPGSWPRPFGSLLQSMPLPRRLPSYRFVELGLRIGRRLQKRHPRAPYLYLCVLGVHPSRQGAGLGGALLRHALADADRSGVPTFLETGNPANLPLYGRFGFDVDKEIRVGRAPPMWTMIRQADVRARRGAPQQS